MPAYELYSSTPILLTPWLPNFASAEHIICSRNLMSPLLLQFLLVSGLIATVAPVFDINQIRVDINASAAQELVSRLRPKLLPPPSAFALSTTSADAKSRSRFSPRRLGLLESRQSCTGNADNYCFGTATSWCGSCGLCCIQAAGGWCCPSSGAICCPAATVNQGSGCCHDWQLCQSSGCVDPS
jgi:hypothetical protein